MRRNTVDGILGLLAFIAFMAFVLIACGIAAHSAEIDPTELHANTVILTDGYGHGSGVLLTRVDGEKRTTFIWTAAHVANCWMNEDGSFRDIPVVQGDKRRMARVLRASDHFIDTDCAVLELLPGDASMEGTVHFYRAFNHVKLGQRVVHCGTPLDRKWNERLVSYGRVSAVDRVHGDRPLLVPRHFDHVDLTAYPGCSGGPVVDEEDGGIVGLVILGSEPGLEIIEPTRYIYQWAKTHDCLWAFDREYPMPESIFPWPGDKVRRPDAWKYREADDRWGDPLPEPEPEREPEPEPEPLPEPEPEPTPAPEQPAIKREQSVIDAILSLVA